MKKLFCALSTILLMASCSSDDDFTGAPEKVNSSIEISGISIVKLSDYSKDQVKATMNESSYLLRFEDENTFNKTVETLKELPINQRLDFYNQIGYVPATAQLLSADDELDKIFDIEDDNLFLNEYSKFKKKHSGQFVYNSDDTYDLSPYLPYSDEALELVGDIKGQVVIGEELIKPKNSVPVYHEFFDEADFQQISENMYIKQKKSPTTELFGIMAYEPNFVDYKNAHMMIKKGKYQSTMTVGRLPDRESGRLVVRYASQKKKKFWKRRHETTYQGLIRINSGGSIFFNCGLARAKVYIDSPIYRPSGRFGLHMEFTSGCCSGVNGKQDVLCQTY